MNKSGGRVSTCMLGEMGCGIIAQGWEKFQRAIVLCDCIRIISRSLDHLARRLLCWKVRERGDLCNTIGKREVLDVGLWTQDGAMHGQRI